MQMSLKYKILSAPL